MKAERNLFIFGMIFAIIVGEAIIVGTPSTSAQTAPDASFLQRAVNVLQAQRNAALDAQAVAEANLAGAKEDLAKAQARIKELTPKSDEAQPK